ncbi:VQ motif-containing protein 4 [Arabidopsis thaliana]|uniref:VQ motif-containing protein n=3 Tax=Arabidopsis TaxID=3701 RepID=B3H653_ARATH|nr:VQ motif-containing protein [Arabidopsis thaliana]AEE30941.1 VQ motif-containing protein [Arabidopsis thaliana]KAG7647804.1 VQ motif [Arabidopsis thaliana x Arabidopsis arenosa]KAG7655731.1 VQ motif [Arabidopsis suecica]|eukprot:NP_001117368.1 VQ motif-containing protein [Arabidopsis thaliana]
MENSPRYREATNLIPSPRCHNSNNSCGMSSSSESNKPPTTPTRHVTTRSESGNPYPTTFVQADTSSFKQVVQMLTGSAERPKHGSSLKPNPTHHQPDPRSTPSSFSIPPIKAVPNKKQSSSSASGFRLYERRNSMKNLKINPLNPVFNPVNSAFSPRKPEILSPSILDFPSLVLSPVTPLIPDPFDRSGSSNQSPNELAAEEKAMKERGFYLHPSPATTPMDPEPRLLPLFPVTSPRVSVNKR